MSEAIPEPVRAFVTGLLQAVKDKNTQQIHGFYETSWNKISEKFFKTAEWPTAEAIAALAENSAAPLLSLVPRSPFAPSPRPCHALTLAISTSNSNLSYRPDCPLLVP